MKNNIKTNQADDKLLDAIAEQWVNLVLTQLREKQKARETVKNIKIN